MTPTTSLADFLLRRIEEDEEAARAATYPSWVIENEDGLIVDASSGRSVCPGGGINYDQGPMSADADHIVRHDPVHVLAECTAKRTIVGLHYIGDPDEWLPESWACRACQWDEDCDAPKQPHQHGAGRFPCPTLRALALPYAEHPEFRDEWRP